jgi:hypothetical protein
MYILGALILLIDNEEGLCDEDSSTIKKKNSGKVHVEDD